ncbi:MAG: glycosyltransferase family 9 protein [Ignavibacteriaceae bacterium]
MKKIEFFFKNILLKLLLIFNPVKKESSLPDINSGSSILFIRLNRIGDALVATPLFHEVKQHPGCRIIVLADKKNHFIFRNNPSIDEVIVFEKGLSGITGINRIIQKNNIDVIVDLHDDVSTTVSFLVAFAKVKYKVGLRKSNHTLFTHTVEKLDPVNHHVIVRLLKLSELFGVSVNTQFVSVKFYPSEENEIQAAVRIQKMNPDNKYLLGINISAGSDARFWGVDKFKELAECISEYQVRIILFCNESDYHYARKITTEDNIYPTTKDFGNFAAAIMNLDLLITPDTSVVHIASVKKIPVFGIYVKYNTDDIIWSPFNTDFEYVLTEEPTLKNISFKEVKIKLIPFLEKHLNAKTNS